MSSETHSKSTKSTPPIRLARSLDDVGPGMLVAIDRRGEVRSPTRFRAIQFATYAMLAFVATFGLYVYTQVFGVAGAVVVGLFTAYVLRSILGVRRLNRVSTLLSLNRLDEAEPQLDRLAAQRFLGTMMRGHARRLRAALLSRRGQHAATLVALREAIATYRKSFYRSLAFPWLRTCEYGEVVCLCELGQVREAKDRFAQIDPAREGEFLQISRWGAELMLAFASGESTFEREVLFERAQRGLRMTQSAALLALCAWGYVKLGDDDMAEHLLREAFERNESSPIEASAPSLWRWMNEQRTRFDAQIAARAEEEARLEARAVARAGV